LAVADPLARLTLITKTNITNLFITVCKAHNVDNLKSEALEAVARWSVIGKVGLVSF